MADASSLGTLSFRDLPALLSLDFVTIENKAKEMMTCSGLRFWSGDHGEEESRDVAGDVAGQDQISEIRLSSL